jgi:hypothetical protein
MGRSLRQFRQIIQSSFSRFFCKEDGLIEMLTNATRCNIETLKGLLTQITFDNMIFYTTSNYNTPSVEGIHKSSK